MTFLTYYLFQTISTLSCYYSLAKLGALQDIYAKQQYFFFIFVVEKLEIENRCFCLNFDQLWGLRYYNTINFSEYPFMKNYLHNLNRSM